MIESNTIVLIRPDSPLIPDTSAILLERNSDRNKIIGNEIKSCSKGIFVRSGSTDNEIYHNNFVDNVEQARDDGGTNYWDDGGGNNMYKSSVIGGNYWSDYTGSDTNGDGIGEEPYKIPGTAKAQDNYPLVEPVVAVEEQDNKEMLPESFRLLQNYPNPFNPVTIVKYELPNTTEVSIAVYNTLGRTIKMLVDKKQDAGCHEIKWNGTDHFGHEVSGGVYFVQMRAGAYMSSIKILYLK